MTMNNQPQLELQQDTTISHMTVDDPKRVDVLSGRSMMCFRHEGNDRFRMLIAEHADTYKMSSTKTARMDVVALVVDIVIARGGRFLVPYNFGTWLDGGRKLGKKKAGYALRDALRGRIKCITEMREVNAQVLRNTSNDSSHSSAYDRSEEFDLNTSYWLDISRMNLSMLEPSNDLIHIKVEKEIEKDLLKLFIAEQLEEAVPATSLVVYHYRERSELTS
jgi:hypothetical protein